MGMSVPMAVVVRAMAAAVAPMLPVSVLVNTMTIIVAMANETSQVITEERP